MYNPRIKENHIRRLFHLKEAYKSLGERVTMVGMVKEALERYLPIKEEELRQKRRAMKEINRNGKTEKRGTETAIGGV